MRGAAHVVIAAALALAGAGAGAAPAAAGDGPATAPGARAPAEDPALVLLRDAVAGLEEVDDEDLFAPVDRANALVECGPAIVPRLVREVADVKAWPSAARFAMVEALSRFPPLDALPGLVAAASDPNHFVATRALEALAAYGPAAAEGTQAAISALGSVGTPVGLRCTAASALARIGPPSAGAALARVMGDQDPRVRACAAKELETFLLRGIPLEAPVRAALAAHLAPENPLDLRIRAAEVLAAYDGPEGTDLLVDLARRDPSEEVRAAAASGLPRVGTDEALDVALELLRDPSPRVRRAACAAARFFPPHAQAEPIPALIDALKAPAAVAQAAHRSLQHITSKKLPARRAAWRAWWDENRAAWEHAMRIDRELAPDEDAGAGE